MPAPRIDTSVPNWKQQAEFQRPCKKCGAPLYFVRSKQTDKHIPYTEAGISHFEDCPFANDFSRSAQPANSATATNLVAPPPTPAKPQQDSLFGGHSQTDYPD
jgi:hypothetical protein